MFKIGNISASGYRAHSIVKRAYDRIDDATKAIASGDTKAAGAASVVISNLLGAEIAGSQQAARNAADGMSTLQTFGNAVRQISDKLTEMSRLATKAASGYYSQSQKYKLQLEFEELGAQINEMVRSTQFNGNKLLSSDGKTLSISLRSSKIEVQAADLGIDLTGYDLTSNPTDALSLAKEATSQTNGYYGYLGRKFQRLAKTAKTIQFDIVKAMGYQTSIANTDLAEEIATETMGRIQAERVVLIQTQGKVAASRALQLLKAA